MRMLLIALSLIMFAGQAIAEQRYALLIGNEDYPATVGPLNNPHEDVARIREALIDAGFPAANITVANDATQGEINLAVANFASKLKAAGDEGIGFFYYSGHGGSAEASGVRANYLIPAKTPLTGSEQLPILGVPMSGLIDSLAAANAKAVFVVSDACRNTLPFTSTKGGSTDKGMVRVQKRSGLFIAYATADGATAPDDGSFSKALAKQIRAKGKPAHTAFTHAFREVARLRPGNALPFSSDGLLEDICFAGCDLPPEPQVILPNDESQALGIAISSGDLDKLHAFQRQFPNSKSIDLINRYVGELTTERAKASGVPMFMTAAPEPVEFDFPAGDVSICQAELNKVLADQKIRFSTGTSNIDSSSDDTLKRIFDVVFQCGDTIAIEVQGHTDSMGSSAMNQQLSETRARAIMRRLTTLGISTTRISAVGFGESNPIASNDTAEGRALNRRFEIIASER